MDAKLYLSKSLRPIAGEGVDTVVEYISTFDKTKQSDMIQFLEENFGHHASFVEIVSVYCGMFGGPVSEHQYPSLETSGHRKTPLTLYPTTQAKKKSQSQKGKGATAPTKSSKRTVSKSTEALVARKICGCFATHHEFVTSCLQCGRIHCKTEGMGPCLFCDTVLIGPCVADNLRSTMPNIEVINESTVLAYKQKDKLLTFDRENAARTRVNDAQGDYYETSTWLTDEEKAAIDKKEKLRLERYKRSGRQLKISFDFAGRKIVDSSGPDEVGGVEEVEEEGCAVEGGDFAYREDDFADSMATVMTSMENTSLYSTSSACGTGRNKSAELYRALRDSVLSSAANSSVRDSVGDGEVRSGTLKVQHVETGVSTS